MSKFPNVIIAQRTICGIRFIGRSNVRKIFPLIIAYPKEKEFAKTSGRPGKKLSSKSIFKITKIGFFGRFTPDMDIPCIQNKQKTLPKYILRATTLIERPSNCMMRYWFLIDY